MLNAIAGDLLNFRKQKTACSLSLSGSIFSWHGMPVPRAIYSANVLSLFYILVVIFSPRNLGIYWTDFYQISSLW